MSLLNYFNPKYVTTKKVESTKDRIPRKFYDVSEIISEEIEQYKKLDKWSLIRLLEEENKSIRFLEIRLEQNQTKEDLLSKLFLTRILTDLIEETWDSRIKDVNWRDLCYISLMESPTPDQIIKEIIREIKRKNAFNSTILINNVLQRKIRRRKIFIDLKNNKQNTLESYFTHKD